MRRGMLTAGAMRTRITIQEATRVDDGLGGFTLTWGAAGHTWPTWAEKRYVSGGDTTELEQTQPRRQFTYRMRRRKDITVTSAMRTVEITPNGTLTASITAVAADDEDRSAQILHCTEFAPT